MATQSLYRRYRPRRFADLRGQPHVVRALRDAVASGREGQAYLFSGPRGTGKTSSARILAKVLNCERVVDGEPCCECDSCLAVEHGTSYDVHELDAASNNGVDAIRDLVEKASLGSPGRHKVYILDEVHMLSRPAEAALLKTLEEPPPHVVFVLATTDPQKMSDTIRSRTQHLQFHLLPADELAEHVRWVADDAGFDLPEAAFDVALARGGGSARDTLTALELLASTGVEVGERIDLDEFVEALAEHDPGRALTAMAHAVSLGHDARTICEDLVRHLRNGFLALMAPELVVLPRDEIDDLAVRSQRLGTARLVRAIEQLGSILVEMRHAPDPRILADVTLVQLTTVDDASDIAESSSELSARIARVERRVEELATRPAATTVPTSPTTGRAVLGGAATKPTSPDRSARRAEPADQPAATPGRQQAAAPAPAAPSPSSASASATASSAAAPSGAASSGASTSEPSVVDAWNTVARPAVKPIVRALYSGGSFTGEIDGRWQFEVANDTHAERCERHRAEVEAAIADAVGRPVSIELVVAGRGASEAGDHDDAAHDERPAASAATRAHLPDDDDVDPSELTDAPPESVQTPLDRLAEAFPGSEIVDE